MGKDLSVKFFKQQVYEKYDKNTCMTLYYTYNLNNEKSVDPYEYNHIKSRNVDLGFYDDFSGTKEELIQNITNMINDPEDGDYLNFEAIGHLSLIVNAMGEKYNYVIIEND